MCEWLLTPARVSTFLGASKYPTLTVASLSFNCLLAHCNTYLGLDSQAADSQAPITTIHEVQQEASEKCLQYLIKYQDNLKSAPARIAAFLDPKVPVPTSSIELNLDIDLVESMMNTHYHMYTREGEVPDTQRRANKTQHVDMWSLLGIDSVNVISDSRNLMYHCLKIFTRHMKI
ncbi:hypothetical protein R1sor_014657 [Riccia sorocarpa]|uniref:Uncharacterized protein n=1 Tax=Riccia sorocarpa TaxID=122646 RepID=A0ABD3HA96_9MARC